MNRIKELRNEAKLTQSQLAKKIGVNPVTLSRYETGDRNPKLDKLEMMSEIFHVSVDYLTGKTDSRTGFSNQWDDLSNKMNIGPNLNLKTDTFSKNNSEELDLISHFRKLNQSGKNEALKQVENLSKITDYTN